jgi:glycosyltransferase involved in cell wall biosynthesis
LHILFISGLYQPGAGGAEISAHTLLSTLSMHHRVFVLTGPTRADYAFDDTALPTLTILRIPDATDLRRSVEVLVTQERVDVIFTQGMWSNVALRTAKQINVPVVYFARAAFGEVDLSFQSQISPDYIVANSSTVRDFVVQKWNRPDTIILPPLIDLKDYVSHERLPTFVSMINPVRVKGGFVMRDIVSRMVDGRFLIVRGWDHLRTGLIWNAQLMKEMAESHNVTQFDPEEACFDDLPNATVWQSTNDMREVYSVTRLLLIPSIVREGLPRVAVEAMANGIPLIASQYGVNEDVVGTGGVMVRDCLNPNAWIERIREFDEPNYYRLHSAAAAEQASKYDWSAGMEQLLCLLSTVPTSMTRACE